MPLTRLLSQALLGSCVLASSVLAATIPEDVPTQRISSDCPRAIVEPYTGDLYIESKYDQSDASKSILRTDLPDDGQQAKLQIQAFSGQVVSFADYYLTHTGARQRQGALACLHAALGSWADAGALLSTNTSKTGVAVRKWTLAAIATASWKLQRLSTPPERFDLTQPEQAWLTSLGQRVVQEYEPRLDPDFAYFNNHDYWAGWALVVTAMAVDRPDFAEVGYRIFDRAMQQIVQDSAGRFGWLPNEVARAHLATNYLNYALIPLALLARHAGDNDHTLTTAQRQRLDALVRFVVAVELQPDSVPPVLAPGQDPVPTYKLVWLLPLLDLAPEHTEAQALYQDVHGEVDGYRQAGGLLAPLYPAADQGAAQ